MKIRRLITWLRRLVVGGGLGALWGFVAMWVLGTSAVSIAFTVVTSLAFGISIGRFYLYLDGNIARFWPMRIRRHCYDKPHRCPGWAGGGRKIPREGLSICPSGSFASYMYEQRLWQWRFHRCGKCGTVALPVVVKYIDPFWWALWKSRQWRLDFASWREDRQEARQRNRRGAYRR